MDMILDFGFDIDYCMCIVGFGKITGVWYSIVYNVIKYYIFLESSPQETDQICSLPTKNWKKEPRKPTRCIHFRPNSYPKIQKIHIHWWSVLAQKLQEMDTVIISDQLISDHCVVGFRPEAPLMDPPTDLFLTTVWSFLQLGPTAEPRTFLPTNTFPTVIGRF